MPAKSISEDDVKAKRNSLFFRLLIFILGSLDLLAWLVSFMWVPYLTRSRKLRSREKKQGDEQRVRVMDPKQDLTTDCLGASTVCEIIQKSVNKYGANKAFGTRTYLGERGEGRKVQKIFGETTWRTYDEVGSRAKAFGSALRHIGMVPFTGTAQEFEKSDKPGHSMLIFENTCDSWTTAFFGAATQSIIVATSYATLGIEAVISSLEETNSSLLVCNYKDVEKIGKLAKDCKTLKTIVYSTNYVTPEDSKTPPKRIPGVAVYSFEDFIALGENNTCEPHPPKPESLAVIMYTSGSTGKPKGVMLTNMCLASAAGGAANKFLGAGMFVKGKEVYLSYLPAAHILELTVEVNMFAIGGALGFCDPKTLSSKGAVRKTPDGEINDKPGGDYPPGGIQEFRPTVMAGVPKVWDVLKKGAQSVIQTKPVIVQALLAEAMEARDKALKNGTDAPIYRLIFGTFKKMLGGRLKAVISGGGPISSETQSWVRCAMCPVFVQGYGLTESNGATCVQDMDDVRDGIAGVPLSSVELRMNNVETVVDSTGKPYLNTDTEHSIKTESGLKTIPCLGRGELWIRGATVAQGYFKMPKKTAEEFTEDRWFKTGDICIWTADGSVKIVDRLKNLVKLKGGEYIAIENMEKEYTKCSLVSDANGGVMVIGDGTMDRACLLVQANMDEIRKLAESKGITAVSDEPELELCRNPEITKMALDELVRVAAPGLSSLEKIKGVLLLPGTGNLDDPISEVTPWSPDNGGLTPSNKLNRKPIEEGLKTQIKELKKKGTY